MLGMKTLLFTALGLAGLLWFGSEAKADTPADTDEPKVPPPKPTTSTAQAAQQGGANCKALFDRWSGLADRAAQLCAEAAQATDMWWGWEELRLSGDPSYDAHMHEVVRARWAEAQDNCNDINSTSLAAMADYEACMVANGLNPRLPSAATQGVYR